MRRVARDVSVHVFRSGPSGPRYLMLRRLPGRGGFWQPVTGAPQPGETDAAAATREVREETGFDVRGRLLPLGVGYRYALDPAGRGRWDVIYGPGVDAISVAPFGAEAPAGREPVLDPLEHDAYAWHAYREADALLDWPLETDALAARREALRLLHAALTGDEQPPHGAAGKPQRSR